MSPPGRWALTPPFHPYQAPRPLKICPRFFLWPITEAACAGGIFSVALSVAEPFLAQPPGVTRRAALRCPDFPPAVALRQVASDHPARSLVSIIRSNAARPSRRKSPVHRMADRLDAGARERDPTAWAAEAFLAAALLACCSDDSARGPSCSTSSRRSGTPAAVRGAFLPAKRVWADARISRT